MSVRIRAFGRKAYTFSARRNIVVSSAQLSLFVAYTQAFAPAHRYFVLHEALRAGQLPAQSASVHPSLPLVDQ